MEGITIYGKDWKKVQQYVGTRTSAQSRSHAQKVLTKLNSNGENGDDSDFLKSHSGQRSDHDDNMEPKVERENNDTSHINNDRFKTPWTEQSNFFEGPSVISRKRLHSDKDGDHKNIAAVHKRKWTIDYAAWHSDDDLMIENDEVSLKLLRKLTTPIKKSPNLQSFSYSKFDCHGFKFELNSEIDSCDGDDLESKSGCNLPIYGNFIADVIEDAYF